MAYCPSPNLKGQGLLLLWSLPLDQSDMVKPARGIAIVPVGTALGVSAQYRIPDSGLRILYFTVAKTNSPVSLLILAYSYRVEHLTI